MKKILIFITLGIFNFSISFAESYLNLESFNDLVYGKNILDIIGFRYMKKVSGMELILC